MTHRHSFPPIIHSQFYPRDASVGISCRRVSVCLSVTRRYCIKTDARIELGFFGYGILSSYVTQCFKEITAYLKMRVLPALTLSRILVLGNLSTARRPSASAI